MKSLVLLLALVGVVVFGTTSTAASKSSVGRKQKAVIKFDQPVILLGVTLKGEYLVVHDDEAMNRGEACTHVYKGNVQEESKLIVSFHCVPVERAKVAHFTVRTTTLSPDVTELREFQFKGDIEAHGVPLSK